MSEFVEPPEFPKFERLDFSQFHPLDHWLGSARCRSMYGGPRNHLSLWWVYQAKPRLYVATRCRLGWHRATEWRSGPGARLPFQVKWMGCQDCGKPLSERTPA